MFQKTYTFAKSNNTLMSFIETTFAAFLGVAAYKFALVLLGIVADWCADFFSGIRKSRRARLSDKITRLMNDYYSHE